MDDDLAQWMDEVSAYLHMLAFGAKDIRDRPLPPVREGSDVLDSFDHGYLCQCPRCRGAA